MNLIYSSLAKSPVCQIGTELEDIKLCEGWRGPGERGEERAGGELGSQAPAHRLKPELDEDLLKDGNEDLGEWILQHPQVPSSFFPCLFS